MPDFRKGWADIIKVRAVAAAATDGISEAIQIQTYESADRQPEANSWVPPDDKTISEIIEKHFGAKLPFAVAHFPTEYAKPLEYVFSKKYGIGGVPNCIVINGGEYVLAQFRKNVDRRAMLHAAGLQMILESNMGNLCGRFNGKQELPLSGEIYFINETGFVLQSRIQTEIKSEVLVWADKLREIIKQK